MAAKVMALSIRMDMIKVRFIIYGACLLFVVFIFISRLILQKISRLAVQGLAEGGQGREAHGLRLACLEDRQVSLSDSHLLRQLSGRHLPLCQHYVYVYYDWHISSFLDSHFVFFLICSCHLEKLGYYDHADSEAEEVTVRAVYHDVIMFQRNMVLCPEISEYFKDPL